MTSPTSQISQEEIINTLWKACDTLFFKVNPTEYKYYIISLLFLKYISDVWLDKSDAHQETSDNVKMVGDDGERLIVVPDGADFYSLFENRNDPNIGNLIDDSLAAIEDENNFLLGGIFSNVRFGSASSLGIVTGGHEAIMDLLALFCDLNLRPSQIGDHNQIGEIYDELVERLSKSEGKRGGEYYTPQNIVELINTFIKMK